MWAHLGADLTPIFSISQAVPRAALPSTFQRVQLCGDSVLQDFPPQDCKHLCLVSLLCLLTSTATFVPGGLAALLILSEAEQREQAQEVPWTWTAEELTLEAALPFSLVSWLIHSLGFPRCLYRSPASGYVLWGKPGRPRESLITFLPGAGHCVFLAIQPLLCNISPRQDKAPVSQ